MQEEPLMWNRLVTNAVWMLSQWLSQSLPVTSRKLSSLMAQHTLPCLSKRRDLCSMDPPKTHAKHDIDDTGLTESSRSSSITKWAPPWLEDRSAPPSPKEAIARKNGTIYSLVTILTIVYRIILTMIASCSLVRESEILIVLWVGEAPTGVSQDSYI